VDPAGADLGVVIDCVIVGAGLSGLVCARRLAAAGVAVRVLEAQRRVGGRTLSARFGGAVVDLGGQWLSLGQPRLAALIAELGVDTAAQYRTGAAVADLPGAGLLAALRARRAVRALERLTRAPPTADRDAITLADWLAGSGGAARGQLEVHAALTFAAEPDELSFQFYLAILAATGGFGDPRGELPGGGRERRLCGGAQQLSLRVAAALGDAVRVGEPVIAIADDGATVRVRTERAEHAARRAVVAVPPPLAARIAVTPPWPAPARRFLDAARMGAVVKCVIGYDRAFWREAGLSGEAYQRRGAVRAVVDLCEPDGTSPALLVFVVGAEARRWGDRDPEERRAAVIDELVAVFGDAAASPAGWLERDWARDPWSGGCVAGLGPGALSAGAAVGAPHGRIHVAGTETASAWPGYMEGAIEAGERAAGEVIASL
jgi:monoamine oxidase